MMAGTHSFRKPGPVPGKERGQHAGYDTGGELVYIGIGDMKMHKAVIEKIEREWDEVFGNGLSKSP